MQCIHRRRLCIQQLSLTAQPTAETMMISSWLNLTVKSQVGTAPSWKVQRKSRTDTLFSSLHFIDATGQVAKYHIPARFVTQIPREFPASQANTAANKNKRKGGPLPAASNPAKREKPTQDDFLEMSFSSGNFDSLDLDFDKPLDEHE